MLRILRPLLLLSAVTSLYSGVFAQTNIPSLGTPLNQQQIEGVDLIVGPDGSGLPPGAGNAISGETVYRAKCQACHGAEGEGLSAATRLVGGSMSSEGTPIKTVGSYWPHATTIFDYIRRAMPANAPKSLTDEEVYQVTAYVLFMNDIISKDTAISRDSLPQIKMPNSDGFIDRSEFQ